ncbi:MAG: hypothetical protein R3Y68_09250 [Rikenellaceae bacterium]
MKIRRCVVSTLALLSLLEASAKPRTKSLIVDPTDRRQQVLFIGTDMERSQDHLSYATNKEEVAEWCFKDIDFNVCRFSYDKHQEMVEGESRCEEYYANCVEAMQLIRKANPKVEFWGTLKSDYYGYGNPPKNNLPQWICDYEYVVSDEKNSGSERGVGSKEVKGKAVVHSLDTKKYAYFLVDFLEHFHTKGLTIKYLSTGKEWTQFLTAKRTKEVIEQMLPELERRSVPTPRFVDASTWSTAQGAKWVDDVTRLGFESYYYGFCTHNYNSHGTANYQDMVERANAITTPNMWEEPQYYSFASETGGATMGPNHGVDAATSISSLLSSFSHKCEIFADGMHGELIFEIFSRELANESRAVYFSRKNGYVGTRLSNYYALQSHGNFFEDGMYYLGAERMGLNNHISTMQFANDDQLYIAVINKDKRAVNNFRISLNDTNYEGAVRRHEMSEQRVKVEGDLDGEYYDLTLANGELIVTLAANSINFFKINYNRIVQP